METYHCYSDASGFDGVHAYGIVVVLVSRSPFETIKAKRRVVHRDRGLIQSPCVVFAELMAMAKALEAVPRGAAVVSHSDLRDIERILSGRTSYSRKMVKAVGILKAAAEGVSCTFTFDKRDARSHYYTECHRMAYETAKAESRCIYRNRIIRLTKSIQKGGP